jgi:tetratricopeptide (TPR) repeat protein
MLRIRAFSYYEMNDSLKALEAIKDLFAKIPDEKITAVDYEYYGKTLIANSQDSAGVIYLRKAFQMDNQRCDLLVEAFKIYEKHKNYLEAASVMSEKIQNCRGATVTDYFNLGRSYFFSMDYQRADTAFAKVNEVMPAYASGWLWRAMANANIDSTMAQALAKPFYEKYIEVANADTAGFKPGKYKTGLVQAYWYFVDYSFTIEKNTPRAKEYLNRILSIDPTDQKAKDALRGIEFEQEGRRQ